MRARAANGTRPSGLRRYHSVAQDAKRLGVSTGWLYTEIRGGRFPHTKLGERVLLNPEETDVFLAERAVTIESALARAVQDGI